MLANFGAKNNIFLETAMTKEIWIKGEKEINKLNKVTSFFGDNFHDYEKERKVKNEKITEMKCNTPRIWGINR